MTAKGQQRDSEGLYLDGRATDEATRLTAETAIRPAVQAAITLKGYTKSIFDNLDLTALVLALTEQTRATQAGDLSQGEAMLAAQAHTLDAIFNALARRAIQAEYRVHLDTYLKLALRAQSQSRATWETLAMIKSPPIVGYVRQANIAHGLQQVNNASAAPEQAPHARENENLQNKLLEKTDGNKLDFGATGSAGRADWAMATLGALDRAEDRGR